MDNKRKGQLKSCKTQLRRDQKPPLKPDVMLKTKDVMVPVKLPPSLRRRFPTANSCPKTKLGIEKKQRLIFQGLKPFRSKDLDQSYTQESLPQVKEIMPEENIREETLPESPFCYAQRANEVQKNVYPNINESISLEERHLSLRLSSGSVAFSVSNRKNIESVQISQVDKPVISLSGIPLNRVTTSADTRSCSSGKSLDMIESSVPEFPFSIISSSGSESTIYIPDRGVMPLECYPKISVETNYSQNVVKEMIENNTISNPESDVEYMLNSENMEFTESNLYVEPGELHQNSSANDTGKLIIDHCNDPENNIATENFEDRQIMIDVPLLVQSLITSVETVKDRDTFDNCSDNFNIERQFPQTINNSNNTFDERVAKIIEFKYSYDLGKTTLAEDDVHCSDNEQLSIKSWRSDPSQELNLLSSTVISIKDEEESEIACNDLDVNSVRSNTQIGIKYSWQIIKDEDGSINNEKNSKLPSTEDLCLNKPEVQYSWQKLTSKYLVGKCIGDNLSDANQPVLDVSDASTETTNAECTKNYSSFRETCMHDSSLNANLRKQEKMKVPEDIGRVAANSPLNDIISSMLPEMKLFNRRTSFNNTTAEIVGNHRDNYLEFSSYSAACSIKHVLANLNEMVAIQKHMLNANVKNLELDQGFHITKPLENPIVNTLEKFEIFPSTLHLLDHKLKDIFPADMKNQRNLLKSNNDKTSQDHLSSHDSVNSQDTSLNKYLKNESALSKRILDIAPANLDLSPRSSVSRYQLPVEVKDSDFERLSTYPESYNCDHHATILAANDNLTSTIKNQNQDKLGSCVYEETRSSLLLPVPGHNRRLTENNWERTIAEMEETIGLARGASHCTDGGTYNEGETTSPTESTTLLSPRVQVSLSEMKDAAGDSKTRKDELLTRLEVAMSRITQSEQHLDANWNLDYTVLEIEESISEKQVQLPKQVEEHIKDIVKSAEEYLAKLEEQLNDLRNADEQIINSSKRTFKEIDDTYQLFMDNLCQEINKRRNLLRLETEVFKYEGLAPLRACKQEVDAQIRSTQHLIVLTENMLSRPITFNKERLGKIITASSHMGRIPAVPMPEELPYVTFSPPSEDLKKQIVDRISCLGCVLRMGPAQFTEVCERPACLQLKWHVSDPEYASEEQTFIVQKALGEITEPTSPAFVTVYVGPETSCFVRDLLVDHRITLRVGIQVTDTAWSVHRIAQTSIPAYSWDMDNSDYLITNSGKIATKITQNLSTLLSRDAQFGTNYIIEFKFLEAASGTDDEGIGLVFEPGGASETLKRNGALLITPNGNIFMNGEQKLMQLPKMVLGTRIIFTSEPKDDETLRMTIECANKAVTYDWTVHRPLHFAARFSEPNKWNLMVK